MSFALRAWFGRVPDPFCWDLCCDLFSGDAYPLLFPTIVALIYCSASPYLQLMVLLHVCFCRQRCMAIFTSRWYILLQKHSISMSCSYNSPRGMSYTGGAKCSLSIILITDSDVSVGGGVSVLERDEGLTNPAETVAEAELLRHMSVRSEGR